MFAATVPALLALADGTMFRGRSIGADTAQRRRGRVQHGDDGVPGDPHRSLVRRTDRDADLSAYRQHRDQSRRRRIDADLRRGPGHPRLVTCGVELAQHAGSWIVPARRRGRRHQRHRHPQAHAHPARQGRAERLPDGGQGSTSARRWSGRGAHRRWRASTWRKSSARPSHMRGKQGRGRSAAAIARRRIRASTSSRTTSGSSTTSCACSRSAVAS